MVMVSSCVPAFVFMLAFTLALPWCLVATTHHSVVRTEGQFYCFCSAPRYIRTKLHPARRGICGSPARRRTTQQEVSRTRAVFCSQTRAINPLLLCRLEDIELGLSVF